MKHTSPSTCANLLSHDNNDDYGSIEAFACAAAAAADIIYASISGCSGCDHASQQSQTLFPSCLSVASHIHALSSTPMQAFFSVTTKIGLAPDLSHFYFIFSSPSLFIAPISLSCDTRLVKSAIGSSSTYSGWQQAGEKECMTPLNGLVCSKCVRVKPLRLFTDMASEWWWR